MNRLLVKSFSENPKSAIQNRKWVEIFAITFAFALGGAVAHAQQPTKIPWIGYLAGAGSGPAPAFIQGLRDLGYVEGQNIGIVYRTTEGRQERSADLAAEVVRLKVDVIVVEGSSSAWQSRKPPAVFRLCWLPVPILLEPDLSPAWPDPVETSQV